MRRQNARKVCQLRGHKVARSWETGWINGVDMGAKERGWCDRCSREVYVKVLREPDAEGMARLGFIPTNPPRVAGVASAETIAKVYDEMEGEAMGRRG